MFPAIKAIKTMKSIIPPVKVVIHTEYGGFHINKLMVDWLRQNKGWNIGDNKECYNDPTYQAYKVSEDYYYADNQDKIEFRTNPDLIECVEALQPLYVKLSWIERQKDENARCVCALKVVEVTINLYIRDYHDGKEDVRVYHGISD